jgi:alpha-glucuronidase
LEKVKALADLFRPYGIKVYLTARFSAPIELGKLKTADPLNDTVQLWWKQKVKEIYDLIPDLVDFLLKQILKDNRDHRTITEHMLMEPICLLMLSHHLMEL